MDKNDLFITGLVIFLFIMTGYFLFTNPRNQCHSDNEKFVTTGIVENVEWYGGTIEIFFDDNRSLGLSGSPNAKYDLLEMDELLIPGFNYTFYYHRECVMGDGNTEWWYEGNVIDKIKVNGKPFNKD